MAVHHFEPTHFHPTIGSHEPVLRIKSGDTVATWCVDAGGHDRSFVAVTPGGNPQTGPFYVEGAEPGDTLAVHFDRMYPNRTSGFTAKSVAPWIVDPSFVIELPRETAPGPRPPTPDERYVDLWDIDFERGIARLHTPRAGLETLQELKLDPMLGCFGVAPSRGQAISCATSGQHGGNMDYRGFRQGVTVYFPVWVPGALLHVGDGHAIQGDGEIVGTGIEISFDVQFTVELLKGKTSNWPRAENETEIMAVGNARPLDQCVQHATTELMRWLEQDYGLDYRASSILLGQCIRYDLGNVFDPAYTMVAKIEKRFLPRKKGS
jgi:acetamidase/formamidase